MPKIFKIFALSSAMALCLSACNLTDVIDSDSEAAKEKKPAPIYTPESEKPVSVKSKAQQKKKAPPERLSLDQNGKVVSTVVQESDSSDQSALKTQSSEPVQENDEAQLSEDQEQSIRPESAATSLPDYASGSDFANTSCDFALNESAKNAAQNLAKTLSARVNVEPGQIYVAQSVIPDKYLDCIEDVAKSVASGLANAPSFNSVMTDHDKIHISSQNIGSSRLIPLLVRQCRSNDIPYLAITIVKDIGTTPTLTLRLIRVETGITLSQAYEKLN